MHDLESYTLDLELLKKKKIGFYFLGIFLFILIFFLWFAFTFPLSTYQTINGIVKKEENQFYVDAYVPIEKLETFSHSSLLLYKEKIEYQIIRIENAYELGYAVVTLKLPLQKKEKIENNRLEITLLESRKTLFEKWSDFIRRVNM